MIDTSKIVNIFDEIPQEELSIETKSSCQNISNFFSEFIHSKDENVFSIMAKKEKLSFSKAMRLTIPGEEICQEIEAIRKAIFYGEQNEKIAKIYFEIIEKTFIYIDYLKFNKKISVEDAKNATIAFYEMYGKKCFTINDQLYKDVKNGVATSYKDFFVEYLSKFRNEMKEIMLMPSFGAERNNDSSYRKCTYKFIELLLTYLVLFAYRYDISAISLEKFISKLDKETISDSEAFYQLWYNENNKIIEEEFKKEEFSDTLCDFTNTYDEMLVETKALYETNLETAPIAKESDMRELYKTVYELRKELDAVKKELAEVKK